MATNSNATQGARIASLTCLLVGAFARPPAGALLQAAQQGATLELRPEPENPYDSGAVAVWISTVDLQDAGAETRVALAEALLNFGMALEDLPSEVQLGYLAAACGKPLRKAEEAGLSYASNQECVGFAGRAGGWGYVQATLDFGPNGEPIVRVRGARA